MSLPQYYYGGSLPQIQYPTIYHYPVLYVAPSLPPQDIITEDGLKIEILSSSAICQRRVNAGDKIVVHYTGRLLNGKEFDTSEGGEPFEVVIGEIKSSTKV